MKRVSICLDLPTNAMLLPVIEGKDVVGYCLEADVDSLEARMGKAEFEAALKELST